MRPGDRRTKTMDRDPNTESKAQCLAELSRLSLPDITNIFHKPGNCMFPGRGPSAGQGVKIRSMADMNVNVEAQISAKGGAVPLVPPHWGASPQIPQKLMLPQHHDRCWSAAGGGAPPS